MFNEHCSFNTIDFYVKLSYMESPSILYSNLYSKAFPKNLKQYYSYVEQLRTNNSKLKNC